VKKLILLLLCLGSCAYIEKKETEAYVKYGSCSVVCDYKMNSMTSNNTINDHECTCSSAAAREFNSMHILPLDPPNVRVICHPDCKTVSEMIIQRQPWRGRGGR
jgi:hypothetical protein